MILVIGNLDFNNYNISGQTLRAKSVLDLLKDKYKNEDFIIEDISSKTNYLYKLFKILFYSLRAKNIILIGAYNFILFSCVTIGFLPFSKKTILVPTGGWIKDHFKKKSFRNLKRFKKVYIQSNSLTNIISSYFNSQSICHLTNFRKDYFPAQKKVNISRKIVFNSRIEKSKGIFELINAVCLFNKNNLEKITLDIYGQFNDSKIKLKLFDEINNYSTINYKGLYDSKNTIKVLSEYDLLIFPSYYKGEGLPGSIMDGLFSGLPIIATDWNYNSEMVKHNYNGRLVAIKDVYLLVKSLEFYYNNTKNIFSHSNNSLLESEAYQYKQILNNFSI
jgi:glycosyltransferase involved in cell wall biosynthesis